jgi:hypothetical protein
MRNWLKAGAVITAMALTVACGQSEAEKQAEEAAENAKKAAEAMTAAGGDAAKGMADMAKAMEGMAAAMGGGDGKTVDPVAFDALAGVLPSVSGWEMEKPEGERMTSPFPFSQTETTYRKGDAQVDVKVVDTGFAQMLIAPWSMMLATGYSKESSDGYEKAVTVGGNPGFERYDRADKSGELNVLVGKRFLVTFEGHDLADTKVLNEFASKMDMGQLAGLK